MNEINECLSLDVLNKYYLTEEQKKKLKTNQVSNTVSNPVSNRM
jgi:hypothetical protein